MFTLGWCTECSADIPIHCWDSCHVPTGFPKAPPPLDVQPARSFTIHCNWYASHSSTWLQVTNHISCFRATIFKRINACHASARALAWRNGTHRSITEHTKALHFTLLLGSCQFHYMYSYLHLWGSRGSSVAIAREYGRNGRGSIPGRGKVSFSTALRPAQASTQPTIQRYRGFFPRG
jgi:hypothetical protein